MAFVSRAPRVTGPTKADITTAEIIGPGTYANLDPVLKPKNSVAPFSSSVERETTSTRMAALIPGPGYYDIASINQMTNHTIGGNQSSSFASRVSRLAKDLEKRAVQVPGPGAYDVSESLSSALTTKKVAQPPSAAQQQSNHVKWVKVATAPSVPSASQSYGYEEGPDGQLVMQSDPRKGHTGKGGDIPGPGEYDPGIKLTRPKSLGPDFGRREGRNLTLMATAKGLPPGPGTYAADLVKSEEKILQDKAHGTSTFLSRTKRLGAGGKPAVGNGELFAPPSSFLGKDEFKAMRPEVSHHQAFGSTSRTQVLAPPHPVPPKMEVPGPGHYTAPVRFQQPKQQRTHGVFGSSSRRLEGIGEATSMPAPGPGQYEGHEVMSLQSKLMKQSLLSHNTRGGFGSSCQRFVPPKSTTETTGPGAYNPPPPDLNPAELRRRDRTQGVFKSRTTRAGPAVLAAGSPSSKAAMLQAGLGPGVYQANVTPWIPNTVEHPQSTNPKAYFGTSDRFSHKHMSIAPGPQAEGIDVMAAVKAARPGAKGGVIPKDGVTEKVYPVPGGRRSFSVPGPGTYSTAKSLLKKTFNITIGDTWE